MQLLGKDLEECSPISFNPRTYLDLNNRYSHRVANHESNYNDAINASLSYAALCPTQDAAATSSRSQLSPGQQTLSGSSGYHMAAAALGNLHTGIALNHVAGGAQAPRPARGSASNLDREPEGWSPEPVPAKHHKQSGPMRIHSQRLDRPLECEHMMPCWSLLERAGREQDWEYTSPQDDVVPSSGRTLPPPGAGATGVGSASNGPPGSCHHHSRLTALPDQSNLFFYPESGPLNLEWETKPMAHTSSFAAFPKNYTSLQVG